MRELSSRRRFLKKAAFVGGGALLGTVSLNQISPIWLVWLSGKYCESHGESMSVLL
jgi:hypothetical protein